MSVLKNAWQGKFFAKKIKHETDKPSYLDENQKIGDNRSLKRWKQTG